MIFSQRLARLFLRPRNVIAFGLATAAAVALFLALGGHGASAGASPASAASASYAALASQGPTGLALVTSHSGGATGEPPHPTWPAEPPEGTSASWPLASSIRRLSLTVPDLSAWIATSIEGGICVLLYDGVPVDGTAAVYATCSAEGSLESGDTTEVSAIPGKPGQTIIVGVVPDGVTAVGLKLADGSKETVPVQGNAWALVSGQSLASGQKPTLITGG